MRVRGGVVHSRYSQEVRILLTGATGYIGGLLLRRLEADGQTVRCLVRDPAKLTGTAQSTEIVQGDCLDEASLERALAGIESAYYLVHSMGSGADFAERDHRAADNFGRAAAQAGVRRIIYLGGLTDDTSVLSAHLKSRAETGEALRASGVPVIEFRASVVIGAGSLSFQMIQALVEASMEIRQDVRDRDRLGQCRHPARADHHRQALDEGLDHLE